MAKEQHLYKKKLLKNWNGTIDNAFRVLTGDLGGVMFETPEQAIEIIKTYLPLHQKYFILYSEDRKNKYNFLI